MRTYGIPRIVSLLSFGFALLLGCVLTANVHVAHAAVSDEAPAKLSVSQPADTTLLGDAASAELSVTAKAAKPAKPSKKQLKAFKKASADFALELFGRCVASKGKNANVTVAPMSVMNALAMAANGARGKTSAQMREVLGDGASMSRINKNLRWYNSKLANSKKARVNVANAIWFDDDGALKLRKPFAKKARYYYGAQVTPSDFSDPSTVDDINAWVAQNTNNMIKRIVGSLRPEDRIAIVNALYFEADWLVPYQKRDVHNGTFKAANGKKRKVKMMYGTEYKYIEGLGAKGFVKPYAKGYSYVALLPKAGTSLKKFVSKLDGDAFRRLIAKSSFETVHTVLPKYSLSYTNSDMQDQLAKMGMPRAFTESLANFKSMARNAMGNLYLGQVVHKTKVDVDEKGTKAAAATAIFVKDSAAFIDKPKVVRLNRPFVYAIVDNATKLPVFIGTVNDIK